MENKNSTIKKIIKAPVFYVAIIFVLFSALNIINIGKAFNKPSTNPPTSGGAMGAATSSPSNALYVTAIGNVGIGTTTPAYPLVVSSSTDSLFSLTRVSASYPTLFKVGTDSALVINSNNSDMIALKSVGVGFGTTTIVGRLSLANGGIMIDGVPQRGRWNGRVPMNNILTTVDSTDLVGYDSSITIAPDGLPVISYLYWNASTGGTLRVAKCGNLNCNAGNTITDVESGYTVLSGLFTSIAIGADGLPVISYNRPNTLSDGDLKVVKCGNAFCSSGNTITTVDSSGSPGGSPSIVIGVDGYPVISHKESGLNDLKVTKCGNASCSSGNAHTTIDSSADIGGSTSIAVGPDGLPVIAYSDTASNEFRVARCGNTSCSSGNTTTTVDSSGSGDVGYYNAMTIGPDGLPILAYEDGSNLLRTLKCGNASCSTGNTITVIDSVNAISTGVSIAWGADGLPIISYQDNSARDLKVAHCGSALCVPYWTRR